MWKFLIFCGALFAAQTSAQSAAPDQVLATIGADTIIPPVQQMRGEDRKQTLCLALALYHEARGEPRTGQIAVGHVILNRLRASGLSVCQILWQRDQFPWTRKASLTPHEFAVWRLVQETALAVSRHRQADITHGATLFYNPRLCHPTWAAECIVTAHIGDHVFMRPRVTAETK